MEKCCQSQFFIKTLQYFPMCIYTKYRNEEYGILLCSGDLYLTGNSIKVNYVKTYKMAQVLENLFQNKLLFQNELLKDRNLLR